MIELYKTKNEIKKFLTSVKKKDLTVGFVPTMGYLHQGHLELIAIAKQKTDIVVVSIYVNPTQFGINEDYHKYPRNQERDLSNLEKYEPLYVFLPADSKMYNQDHRSWITINGLSDKFCGASRPDHFKGVTTIVAKLLNIISPDYLFMGEKDFQQLIVLKKMISDLDFKTIIVPCKTVREEDGLAMSSRNKYLSQSDRYKATNIYKSLQMAKDMYTNNLTDSKIIKDEIKKIIEQNGGKIDYIEVVDGRTLDSMDIVQKGCRIIIAVYFGDTRLIDNIEI